MTRARIIMSGAAGRMGRNIIALAHAHPDADVVAALESQGNPTLGTDAGILAGVGPISVNIGDDYAAVAVPGTVTLEFTAPDATMEHVRVAAAAGAGIVVGTSGLSREQRDELETLSKNMPTLFAPNMSIGLNVLLSLVADAASRLGSDFDCEIVEIHHNKKKDSPSGTAIALAEAVAAARGLDPDRALVTARQGMVGERDRDEIGVVALRGGDNAGEHTVMLVGAGERVELTHRAASRECLAAGAVRAALWLAGQGPGLYSMQDVIGA
ncbi:MAG: 4-hydroxy-tetrahydrodipicolinate reductase [Hyphomicrobiaceae bacterium]